MCYLFILFFELIHVTGNNYNIIYKCQFYLMNGAKVVIYNLKWYDVV